MLRGHSRRRTASDEPPRTYKRGVLSRCPDASIVVRRPVTMSNVSFCCRFSVISTVVVLAHGVHYATWTWEPQSPTANASATRIEMVKGVDRFDSEQPGREGHARAEIVMESNRAESEVAYLRVVRAGEQPDHASYEAVMASMKPTFIATQEANGASVHEVPASSFMFPAGETLANLRRLAAQGGDDVVAIFIGAAVGDRWTQWSRGGTPPIVPLPT
jgi:hypothetical protein